MLSEKKINVSTASNYISQSILNKDQNDANLNKILSVVEIKLTSKKITNNNDNFNSTNTTQTGFRIQSTSQPKNKPIIKEQIKKKEDTDDPFSEWD